MSRLAFHAHYGRFVHFLMRLWFAWVVWDLVQVYQGKSLTATQPHPNGLAHFIDFTFFADAQVFQALEIILLVSLAMYVFRLAMPLSLGFMLFMVVGLGTLFNSQGAVSHNKQVIGLILLGQWCAYVYGAIVRWRRREFKPGESLTIDDLAVYYAQQMLASVYVAAGISKLIDSGGMFIFRAPNIAAAIAKTHEQDYYKTLDPAVLEKGEAITQFFVDYPVLVSIMFGGALLLELSAFLALVSRFMGIAMGAGLLAFHWCVSYTMELQFAWNGHCILIFFVNIPWMIEWLGRRAGIGRNEQPVYNRPDR